MTQTDTRPVLHDRAAALVAPGTGILAADESVGTMSARLEAAGVPASADARRDYRSLLLHTPSLSTWVSGIILCEETLRQESAPGVSFGAAAQNVGILAGIKVDTGAVPLANTDGLITQGLDGLRERLAEFAGLGAAFAKWRAVLDPATMNAAVISANAQSLARYAALCQEAGLVPIVEPEVLMQGDHSLAECRSWTAKTLRTVFTELSVMGVDPAGIVLKPNMVIAAASFLNGALDPPERIARATVDTLIECVPADVAGIAFLSGGQSNEHASANLAAINQYARQVQAPWPLTYSFGRALVDDALRSWRGAPDRVEAAQRVLARNCTRAAHGLRAPRG